MFGESISKWLWGIVTSEVFRRVLAGFPFDLHVEIFAFLILNCIGFDCALWWMYYHNNVAEQFHDSSKFPHAIPS